MALQEGLLSFQIKETVFLSSDKAGIGELRELELVPDVEIIENAQEISITGCLQLLGKYEPFQEKAEDDADEENTLVAAMKFTPFQLEEKGAGSILDSQEEILTHRVPLNISIPVNRIEEVSEIYAIVDSFDYQLESPKELQILANLKISGIQLRAQEAAAEKKEEESWEFVHRLPAAEEQVQPVSLEEIERKLAALEEEILAQEQRKEAPQGFAPNVYIADQANPYRQPEVSADEQQSAEPSVQPISTPFSPVQPLYGDVSSLHMGPGNQLGTSSDQEPLILPGQSLADGQWDEENTASVYEVKDQLQVQPVAQTQQTGPGEDEEQNMLAAQPQQAQQIQEVLAAPSSDEEPEGAPSPHEQVRQVFVEQPVQQEQEVNAEQHAEEAQEVFAEQAPDVEEALAAQEVFADRPAEDAPEMKVAISGKQNEQSDAKVNITSLFTQPRRLQPQQPPSDEETSSSSSRKVMAGAGRSEAVSNLTSFVRQTEERMSKVRIAILQRNETIEAIAERYHIPVSRILEVNKVSSDRIAEGQILYIPQ